MIGPKTRAMAWKADWAPVGILPQIMTPRIPQNNNLTGLASIMSVPGRACVPAGVN